MAKRKSCGQAESDNLVDVLIQYVNEATHPPTKRKCRLEGFNLKGECEIQGECKLSHDWLEVFCVYAVDLLEDVFWAAHGDDKAARRLSKLQSVFDKKDDLPPAIKRAAEIHAIMHRLRWVTAPHNEEELVQLIEKKKNRIVYGVSDGAKNEPVGLRDLKWLDEPCDPKFIKVQQQLKESYERPAIQELYKEAKQHWHPKATLQSLALDIYLTRHNYIKRDDRDRAREGLRRDLRMMRRSNLTVFVEGFDCGSGETDRFRRRPVL
jgi:hypothetical protein